MNVYKYVPVYLYSYVYIRGDFTFLQYPKSGWVVYKGSHFLSRIQNPSTISNIPFSLPYLRSHFPSLKSYIYVYVYTYICTYTYSGLLFMYSKIYIHAFVYIQIYIYSQICILSFSLSLSLYVYIPFSNTCFLEGSCRGMASSKYPANFNFWRSSPAPFNWLGDVMILCISRCRSELCIN